MANNASRREFLKTSAVVAAATAAAPLGFSAPKRQYDISLAAWSLHKIMGTPGGKGEEVGEIPCVEIAKVVREKWDIGAVELVNNMLASWEKPYLDALAKHASDNNVKILLIMVDGQGNIGSDREEQQAEAVEKHKNWVNIAADLGCHSIRMNWAGARKGLENDPEGVKGFIERSIKPFRNLCEYADTKDINVIIENHGGPSSNPEYLIGLIKKVDNPRFGTLPDFGNFYDGIDRYDAVDAMMPYAKAVSAKCYDFDKETGEETTLDFERFLQICVDKHGYHGHIGIEFEGNTLTEFEGIAAANALLKKLRG